MGTQQQQQKRTLGERALEAAGRRPPDADSAFDLRPLDVATGRAIVYALLSVAEQVRAVERRLADVVARSERSL